MKKKIRFILITFIILLLPLLYFVAFTYAVKLSEEATMTEMGDKWYDKIAVEKSISNINSAIKIYPWNSSFYMNKMTLQARIGDYEGQLETNAKLIEFYPNTPLFLTQRGFIFDLLGDTINAKLFYSKALEIYENEIKSNPPSDYQYELEYIQCLMPAGETEKAEQVLKALKQKYPNDETLKLFPLQTNKEIIDFMRSISLKYA